MTSYLFDLETDGLLDKVTKIHCMVLYDLENGQVSKYTASPGPGEDTIDVGMLVLQAADLIAGHNVVRYDVPVIKKVYPWFNPKGKIRDTLVMAKLIWPNLKKLDTGSSKVAGRLVGSHSLEAWGMRLGVPKGDFGKDSDWKTFSPEMLDYCVQDVVGPTLALWKLIERKKYSEEAFETEHQFTFVAHLMELHGFRFDVKAAEALHVRLVKRSLELGAQLQEKYKGWSADMKTPEYWVVRHPITGDELVRAPTKGQVVEDAWKLVKGYGFKRKDILATPGPKAKKLTPFNPGSRDHIIKVLISDHGWKPSKFTDGGDPKLDEEILERIAIPEAKLLIEYLMIGKRLGQLAEGDAAWLKLVTPAGRIHGRIDAMGTVTGRCSHSRPNMAQIPAVVVGDGKQPLLGYAGRWGYECRSLFIPDAGHVLVGADASGVQLRVLAHYMGAFDGGEYARIVTQGDVHTENMQAIGLASRAEAKTWIYAYLLGAGDAKLGMISGKGAKSGKEDKERMWLRFPALKKLKEALKQRVNQAGGITGLDGRFCPTESAHLAMGALLQSFEAIVVKKAIWFWYTDLTTRGWKFGQDWSLVSMTHDEVQSSSRREIAEEVGKAFVNALERAGEHFKSRSPITGEWKIGGSWADTH